MPRPRRHAPERRLEYAANPRVVVKLLCGSDFGFLDESLGPDEGDADDAQRARLAAVWEEAWRELAEDLCALHSLGGAAAPHLAALKNAKQYPKGPDARPWGWHAFEGGADPSELAPGPRRPAAT
jgi:hypothetical protein